MSKAMDTLRSGATLMALIEQQEPALPKAFFSGDQESGLGIDFQAIALLPGSPRPDEVLAQLSALLGEPESADTHSGEPFNPQGDFDTYDRVYSTHTWHWREIQVRMTSFRGWWETQK